MQLNKKTAAILAVLLVAVLFMEFAEAGGNCQSYGHSCLGGHGKRTDHRYALFVLQKGRKGREQLQAYEPQRMEPKRYDILKAFEDSEEST